MNKPISISKRINLVRYINCLMYLYHRPYQTLEKIVESKGSLLTILAKGKRSQIKRILPNLSYFLDTSKDNLKQALKGSRFPAHFLLTAMMRSVSQRSELYQYLHAVLYEKGMDADQLLQGTSLIGTNISKINKIPVQDVTQMAKNLHTYPKTLKKAFKRAGVELTNQPRQSLPVLTAMQNPRLNLKDYLKAVCYCYKHPMTWLTKQMGYSYSGMLRIIKKRPKDEVINAMRQVPFVFREIPLNYIKAIMKGSRVPQDKMIHKIGRLVRNRKSLWRYIYACLCLENVNLKQVADVLHKTPNYIRSAIMHNSGEHLSKMMSEFSQMLQIPDDILQAALSRVNINSTHHVYRRRMYFTVRYGACPVKYKTSGDAGTAQSNVDRAVSQLSLLLNSVTLLSREKYKRNVAKRVSYIISLWGRIYGFSADQFIRDNLPGLEGGRAKIKQENRYHIIVNMKDWIVILRKIHQQLLEARHASSLPDLQKEDIAPLIYINGVNLAHPLTKGTPADLTKLSGKHHYVFTGQFVRTGIKIIDRDGKESNEFYSPVLYIARIKHNHKLVMNVNCFNYTKGFAKLGHLHKGDLVTFSARVSKKHIGVDNADHVRQIKYILQYPNSVRIIRRIHARTDESVPQDHAALTGFAIEDNKTEGYDFSFRNYGYARYCINKYHKWLDKNRKAGADL